MKTPYDIFSTDQNFEVGAGITLQYPTFSITIHRAGGSNKKYEKVLTAKMKPYRYQLQNGLMDNEVAERIMIEVYAESVIIGWSGVRNKDGDILEFNKENVIQLFTDLPDLFRDVQRQSDNIALFRKEVEEADAKN